MIKIKTELYSLQIDKKKHKKIKNMKETGLNIKTKKNSKKFSNPALSK